MAVLTNIRFAQAQAYLNPQTLDVQGPTQALSLSGIPTTYERKLHHPHHPESKMDLPPLFTEKCRHIRHPIVHINYLLMDGGRKNVLIIPNSAHLSVLENVKMVKFIYI